MLNYLLVLQGFLSEIHKLDLDNFVQNDRLAYHHFPQSILELLRKPGGKNEFPNYVSNDLALTLGYDERWKLPDTENAYAVMLCQ